MSFMNFCYGKNLTKTLKAGYNNHLAENPSKQIYSPFVVDWNVLKTLGCASVIDEMLEIRICQEFYATFEFDEAVADEDLLTEKVVKFRLGGLKNDDNFNVDQYWLDISSEDKLTLSRSSAKTIRKLWMKRKGVGTQRESLICCGQFVTRVAKSLGVLEDDVLDGLNALIYYRLLDANALRELISSNGRLIPEETTPSIPRVATPRVVCHTTSDMYDKIRQLETRINNIKGMMHRQSYHSDIYVSVSEHIGAHQGTTLRDPYNPPNYAEEPQQQDEE
ncbi:hypothetical protein Tco_0445339 [Tanacetum coccineum]